MNSLIYLRGSVTTEVSAFIKSGPEVQKRGFFFYKYNCVMAGIKENVKTKAL